MWKSWKWCHVTGAKQDAEEELPLGQLAQQAQHGDVDAQHAKRAKVQIADDQGPVQSWGSYKTVEHVQQLIKFMNPKGGIPYVMYV